MALEAVHQIGVFYDLPRTAGTGCEYLTGCTDSGHIIMPMADSQKFTKMLYFPIL
ncbi:hypothetical protein D3C73_1568730 [compost metagenome]